MKTRLSLIALTVAALAAPAMAQDAVVEGPGYEVSEGTVLHPSVGANTGLTSNLFYEQADPVIAPVIRVFGTFAIASQDNTAASVEQTIIQDEADAEAEDAEGDEKVPPTLDYRFGGRLELEKFLGSTNAVKDQQSIRGSIDLDLKAYPQNTLSFVLDENFVRDTRPRNFEDRGQLNRDINTLKLGADIHPGNRAIKIALRYENLLDRFESEQSAFANRLQHNLRARGEWQFLPITRFYLDASFGFFGRLGGNGGSDAKASSTPLRVEAGVASAITEPTTIRAHIGYGRGFYSAGQDFHNVIFGVEGGYRYRETGRATLAFEYDFEDSINANFYRDFALVAKLDQQFDRILVHGLAAARLRGYRGVPMVISPQSSRDDLILHLKLSGNYLYRDWFAFTAEIEGMSDTTSFRYDVGIMGLDDPSFNRFDLQLGAVAAF